MIMSIFQYDFDNPFDNPSTFSHMLTKKSFLLEILQKSLQTCKQDVMFLLISKKL